MYYRYKVFIYERNDINTYIAEKAFNKTEEVLEFLEKYIGCWCRFVDLSNLNIIIEGVFKP